jgi:hypothetical protein
MSGTKLANTRRIRGKLNAGHTCKNHTLREFDLWYLADLADLTESLCSDAHCLRKI